MAGEKRFCKLDCSKVYHFLQMADQQSNDMLAFYSESKTFSRALSAFSSSMRENLNGVRKTDYCAQFVDDNGIAANDNNDLTKILKSTFGCIRETGLKLTMNKCHFGATEIDFLGRTITPDGEEPQKERITKFVEKTKLPLSKKALQRYLGFLN